MWSSAIWRLAKHWRPRGATCWWNYAAWKRAAKSAEAASPDAFVGEQFALPEALDLLRAVRRAGESGDLPEAPPADPLHSVAQRQDPRAARTLPAAASQDASARQRVPELLGVP